MRTDPFDLLKRHEDGSFIWLETARDIEIARVRLQELCAQTPGNYFVFDQKSQQIVAKLHRGQAFDAFATRCWAGKRARFLPRYTNAERRIPPLPDGQTRSA
jgi:hypothetical protein